jgi:hypothetical protein
MILPLLFLSGRVEASVGAVGWPMIGGPVMLGVVAMAAALLVTRGGERLDPGWRAVACWTGVGLVLFLLGAAHELTVWVGQACFALAAVMLWVNTPTAESSRSGAPVAPAVRRAGWAMFASLVVAAVQGFVLSRLQAEPNPIGVVIALAYASIGLAASAAIAGPAWAIRIGGWSASVGVLLSIGLLSLLHLLPQSLLMFVDPWRLSGGSAGPVGAEVAYGFGHYAPEAVVLLVLPLLIPVLGRLSATSKRIGGGVLLVIAAAVIAGRVVQL